MKLSFSLPKSNKPVGTAPPLKKPVAFGSLEDDEPIDGAPTTSSDSKGSKATKKHDLVAETSRAMQKRMEAEMKVDSTVYEYDDVWDKMQEAKLRQKQAKEMAAGERKV
jgi:coiled-coil domain-containing protein 55